MYKFIAAIFAVFFILLFTPSVNAQTVTTPPIQEEQTAKEAPVRQAYPLNTNSDVEQNFHAYTQNVFIEVLSAATCFIGGTDMLNPDERCLGMDPNTKKIGYVEDNGGLTTIMGSMIGATFNIPVSTSHYGQYLASNFGFTDRSYAARPAEEGGSSISGVGSGIGFRGLNPVLKIWQVFRNLTYLIFVLVFILLGLGIMFRVNIDARTVMTIQNQIPKIVIALILVTLSYAIAGFLIDLMYVTIYLVIHVFDSQGLATITNIDTNPVMAIGHLGGINGIAYPAATGVSGMINSMFSGSIGTFLGSIVGAIITGFLVPEGPFGLVKIGAMAAGAIGGGLLGSKLLALIAGVIAYLIISLAILSALFRVWFMLIKAYIYIFLDVIFAPFWIVGGILPGAPGGVGPWLRSLAANLSGFPTVIVLFMIGRTIQEQATNVGGNFIPPLIGDPGANSGEAIGSLIGLGIILIMPEAVNITKKAFKAPEMKYSAAVGRAIGAGSSVLSKPVSEFKHEFFGKDALGAPKEGSLWLQKRMGRVGRALTGGGIKDNYDEHGHKTEDGKKANVSMFKNFLRRKKPTDPTAPPTPKPPPPHSF